MMLFLKIWFIALTISFVVMFIGLFIRENDFIDSTIFYIFGEICCWWFPIQILTTFVGGFLWFTIKCICFIFG